MDFSAHVPDRRLAGLLATATGLGAHTAVLMPVSVALALLSAHAARGRADLEHLA
jgi:hypothetical protein